MEATSDYHRPLVSGIRIISAKRVNNNLEVVGEGTLTGLATRKDGKKVLVTNLHVMAGVDDDGNYREPSGTEEMYQGSLHQDRKVGSLQSYVEIKSGLQNNSADVASCELDENLDKNLDIDFTLHDSPHSSRKIVQGVVEPVKDEDNPMRLTMMGSSMSGEGMVIVADVNRIESVRDTIFTGLTLLNSSSRPAIPGDSGAACLYRDGDGGYRMSCIVFSSGSNGRTALAFPASTAERLLGITFGDRPLVASASASPATALPGATVTLDGSGSSGPYGDALTYRWEQVFGSDRAAIAERGITLSDNTAVKPTFTAPSSPAALTFKLTVTDSAGLTATDTVSVYVRAANRAPRAYAGEDKGVYQGATVTLDGSGSSDPDGDALTYAWRQLPGGPRVSLRNADTASPDFVAPTGLSGQEGLKFRLTVSDGRGGSNSDDVWITVVVRQPTAYAGLNRTVAFGSRVTLDGSGSSDPDAGDRLTYQWEQIHTKSVTLNNAASARASFTAPSGYVDLVFKLTVTDLSGHRHSDEVTVRVRDFNRAPTAYAGADRTVSAGETVTLFGSGRDPDGDTLEYAWTQRSGTPVGLTDSTIPRPSFTAPSGAATLVFRLKVTDSGGLSDADDVTITVRAANRRPTADAGRDQTVSAGAKVTLDGSGSSDPDGDRFTYSWRQILRSGAPLVSLSRGAPPVVTFTAPSRAATLKFMLTVTDQHGASDTDDVTVTVRAANRRPTADAGRDATYSTASRGILLRGSGTDPDGDSLTYRWEHISGQAVNLTDTNKPTARFTDLGENFTSTFRLTVTDEHGASDSDEVTIIIRGS